MLGRDPARAGRSLRWLTPHHPESPDDGHRPVSPDGPEQRLGERDLLGTKVYWIFPSGVVRCLSPRELKHARIADLQESEARASHEHVAASFGYLFLGGRVDVTELLQES